VILIRVFIHHSVGFDFWYVHNSRFKILRDPHEHFKRKEKPKKIKEKPTPHAGFGRKARRNGINGLSEGMWVYAVVPCLTL